MAVALVAGACAPKGADAPPERASGLSTPTFAPSPTTTGSAGSSGTPPPTGTGSTPSSSPANPGPGGSGGTPTSSSSGDAAASTVSDPVGDLTPSPADRPPAWADLRGATLRRAGSQMELAIDLGGAAPARGPDPDHTMNIASFYDLDGDGAIDAEVWVTLADDGWGGAYFDDRARTSAYAAKSQVQARVEEGRLVVRFPVGHLRDATVFRWSLASEWGRYEVIGTDLAARDDAPDDDGAVGFPG
mgnify:CR=1 FL=1